MSNQTHGGKGDKPRKVDANKYATNWDRIFGDKSKVSTDKPLVQNKGGK